MWNELLRSNPHCSVYSSIHNGKYFYTEINCFSSHCNFQCPLSNTRLLFQIPSTIIHFYCWDKGNYFPCRCAGKISAACILSRAYTASRVCFYQLIFYPVKTDFNSLRLIDNHRK